MARRRGEPRALHLSFAPMELHPASAPRQPSQVTLVISLLSHDKVSVILRINTSFSIKENNDHLPLTAE